TRTLYISATLNVGDLTRYVPPDDDDDVDVVDSRSSHFLDEEDDADPSLATNTVGFRHSEPFDILGPLVNGDVEEVGDLSLESMKDEEVAMVDGVFEGAFGALGFEMEALVDAMEVTLKSLSSCCKEDLLIPQRSQPNWGFGILGITFAWKLFFSDSDYAGASLDRKSTTGAEYVAAANCCGQNPVFHSKTKHIEIRHHFIRDSYEKKLIQVIKLHTDHNVTDLLTKAFDVRRFNFLIASLDYLISKVLFEGSGPIYLVADETVYKEWEEKMERAATTASSLEADQDSGSGPRCQDTILEGAEA
ncbi:hypothetical protein Tco_1221921, partial [Tanacetum coccineum]